MDYIDVLILSTGDAVESIFGGHTRLFSVYLLLALYSVSFLVGHLEPNGVQTQVTYLPCMCFTHSMSSCPCGRYMTCLFGLYSFFSPSFLFIFFCKIGPLPVVLLCVGFIFS